MRYVLSEHEWQICSILFMSLFSFILNGVLLLFLASIKKYKFILTNYTLIKLYLSLYLFPSNKISYHEWGAVLCYFTITTHAFVLFSTHIFLLGTNHTEIGEGLGCCLYLCKDQSPYGKKRSQLCRLSI